METVRSPEGCFDGLADDAFEPHGAAPVLRMHGEWSWASAPGVH